MRTFLTAAAVVCGATLAFAQNDFDWRGQIAALTADGYTGWVSLETHWPGPGNDKHLASMICGRNLKTLVTV